MTPKEWLNLKISQILGLLPKESGSKRKYDTQQEFVWHLKTQPEGVPEVKKGGLKGSSGWNQGFERQKIDAAQYSLKPFQTWLQLRDITVV